MSGLGKWGNLQVYWNVEIGVAEIQRCHPFPCCKEIRIVSEVSILNVFTLKNLFRALRSKIGRHFRFGLGTMNILLKKARDPNPYPLYCFLGDQCMQSLLQVKVLPLVEV